MSPTLADTIFIPNGSFESPFQPYAAPYASAGFDSWQQSGVPQWWLNKGYTEQDWIDTAGVFVNVPSSWIDNADGRQAAFMFAAPDLKISETLDTTFQVGQAYQLTVGIQGGGYGMRSGTPMGIALYYLDGGGNQVLVGSTSFQNTNVLFPGQYITHLPDRVLTIPAVSASDAWAGKNIGIALLQLTTTAATSGTGGYWDVDNVRLVSTTASAFTAGWSGAAAGNSNWSNSGNWSGTAPAPGTSLLFADPGTGHTDNMNDLPAGISFPGITFAAGAPSFNLRGNPIQISGLVANQSGTNQTISLDMQVAYGGGTFDTGSGSIAVAGVISGSSITARGGGTLILSGENTYSGGTTVLNATLVATSADSLPTGSSVTVGELAQAVFGLPTTPSAETRPLPVPEPSTFALLGLSLAVSISSCCRGLLRIVKWGSLR
jgi:autotransporter-associated beta strand protein